MKILMGRIGNYAKFPENCQEMFLIAHPLEIQKNNKVVGIENLVLQSHSLLL